MLNSNATKALLFLAGMGMAGPGCFSHMKNCETRTEIATEGFEKDCNEMRDAKTRQYCEDLRKKIGVDAMSTCMTIVSGTPMTCIETGEDEFECKKAP